MGRLGQKSEDPNRDSPVNAVDPQNYEPNLALNLEVADLINTKKGNAPREAAVAIVNYVNHRNASVSLLALTLLDICVKNCGYPFHLQISTKEFLNELVRKFPERPPIRPSRVQLKILELIEEWRQTICQTSRYKEDLGFIRDMHRLLSYKGYMFPEVRREDAAVLNRSENLQSADEMEEEERAAQSAKLQELIRRGGPEDLQEANRLMKVMAGYDTRHKTDYRAKAAEEVSKIQQKARLLEERLQNFKPGDQVGEGDVFEELASALQSAQPKIQKMCEEESDDSEAVAKLLEINDSIHRTIERYKFIKKGDLEGASKIPKGTLGTSTGVTKTADNELSLIDFGADTEPNVGNTKDANGANGQNLGAIEDDLLGLSLQDQHYGQSGGIALGFGANTNVPGPSLLSSSTQASSAKSTSHLPSAEPQPVSTTPRPNYEPFSSLSSKSHSVSGSNTPVNPAVLQSQQTTKPPQISTDPFASLNIAGHSQPSLLLQQAQTKPSSSGSLFDGPSSEIPVTKVAANSIRPSNGTSTADDDWNFTSALPEDSTLPDSNTVTVSNTSINILFKASRIGFGRTVSIMAYFSNNTASLVTEFTFQVAVTKGFSLNLAPQSGRTLQPKQRDGITQSILVQGVTRGQADSVKMRWKSSYKLAGDIRQEQGEGSYKAIPCYLVQFNLHVYGRRALFELHPGRAARQAPTDLPIDQIVSPTSRKNDDWHTTSEDLIQALGPIGQEYATPKEFAHKIDLSYTDAFSAALNHGQARQQAAANAALAEKVTKWPCDLKGALVRYLREIAPLLAYADRSRAALSAGPRVDKALLDFTNDWPLRYLRRYGFDITDLMNWAWILTASSSDGAITRFVLVRDVLYNKDISSKSIPNILFTFLLRRHKITPRGLRHLLLHAWSLMQNVSDSFNRRTPALQQPNGANLEAETFRKVIPHVQENGSGFQEDVFIVMIIRLLRHARSIWPAACESIVALCCQYVNGLNFHKGESGGQDPARLAFIYNTMLCLLAAPSSIQPFVSATHQQRAQFAVLRRMIQFNPPLIVDRRGYRAVTQVQLMHKKTLREREWAHMKAKSWPPWKEDRLGIDADIGPDYGVSRAKEALSRAEEAGYANGGWDRAASLLSGWDTDGSPSIQTRGVFLAPVSADRSKDETAKIWANRIRATRTLNEAWGAFQGYKDAKLAPRQIVYQAIFEKLVSDAKRGEEAGETSPPREGILPGDGPEVFSSLELPCTLVYVRTEPPTLDSFIDLMIDDDIRPRGRFLASLLINAPSISFGIRVLMAGGVQFREISALLRDDSYVAKNADLVAALHEIPTYLFDAFIILLARCARTSYNKRFHKAPVNLSVDIQLAPSVLSSPLLHAFRLMRLRKPSNRRPWLYLLGGLARDKVVFDGDAEVGQDQHDIISWHAILKLLAWMQQSNVGLDIEAFTRLCAGLEKALMAAETLLDPAKDRENVNISIREMAQDIISKALPFMKEIFKNLVRADSMQQEIPAFLVKVKARIDRELEQEVTSAAVNPTMTMATATTTGEFAEAHPEFADTPNEHKNFLPASCLLPRLLEIPRPACLHQFVRVLGLRRDYDGLLDLMEWMALHADEIQSVVDELRNGPRMFRRCLIATRVFLERSWVYYDLPDMEQHILVEKNVEPAPKEIWRVIRYIIEEYKSWGGWPSDEEVESYILKGRFV
ncbi:MAG: hypothetical protein Q9163_000099 [Psora crenata]